MRKVIVYIAMSLDGYIAKKDMDIEWLSGDGSDNDNMGSYTNFINEIDTVILGYNTYKQIATELAVDNWPYSNQKSYVLTHKGIEDKNNIIFTDEDIISLTSKLKQEDGKNIWICGGANIVNQYHMNNLIDEYRISIIPIILGDGIRLFNTNDFSTKLTLISTMNYNGIVDLIYKNKN